MDEAKELLKNIPYPLALLTARRGDEINAMPVSWMGQVSSDPLLLQVAVKTIRYTHDMIRDTGAFGVVFLSSAQKDMVPGFKLKGSDKSRKFEGVKLTESAAGLPVPEKAIGWIDLRVLSMTRPGDHTLFVGEINAAKKLADGEALITSHLGKDYHYGLK